MIFSAAGGHGSGGVVERFTTVVPAPPNTTHASKVVSESGGDLKKSHEECISRAGLAIFQSNIPRLNLTVEFVLSVRNSIRINQNLSGGIEMIVRLTVNSARLGGAHEFLCVDEVRIDCEVVLIRGVPGKQPLSSV
jgi:hypothetical protein